MNSRSFFTSLFEPRAIAFIGASTSPAKWGFNILHHLFRGGYEGPVYAVNAKGGDWFGRPMYRNLADAPGRVSMITDSTAALLEHEDLDAVLLLGLGYMTCRATHWLDSPVLPREAMAEPAQKMIDGEKELVDLIVRQIRQFNKPIIPVIDIIGFDEPGDRNIVRKLDAKGIMAYSSPERAIRALAKAQTYYNRRQNGNSG